ncbi:uncharacterized protein M6B38_407445 [Iris pallida]|uniref:Uncharacterized protein n=1 Tax=Iris pallida TaxID=29817 RepID=A0AAX6FQ72_IRIPA|nr:uncharacterized protein M6B38_407445 [Iris pallida]
MADESSLPLCSSCSDRQITTETKVVDVMDNEWTNKKHSLYLDNMEASFVNQLYNRENRSNDLVRWLSRTKTCTNKYVPDPENQTFGQFKVPPRDCWDKVKFKRMASEDDIRKHSHPLSKNLWIQHFRPSSASNEPHLSSANEMDNSDLACESIQESVGRMTEASDQNFVDMEVERGEELRRCSKKRSRPATSPTKDQVVPFFGQTSEDEEKGGSSKKLEIVEAALQVGLEDSGVRR